MLRKSRRRIVWEDAAQRQAVAKIDAYPRLYEVIKNFEWLLERQPDNHFAQRIDAVFWLIKSDSLFIPRRSTVPEVTLIYYFDENTVTFWDIRIEPPPSLAP